METIPTNIYPLFSSPVVTFEVKEDLLNLQKIKTEYKFISTNEIGSNNSHSTESRNILEDFPKEKQILLNYFYLFKDEVLKFNSTEFKITTSWATKTDVCGFSQYHNHTNSVFSGVFYFDDIDGGNIEFSSSNIIPETIQLNPPSEINLLNTKLFYITPKKNMLIFFPSYLIHRVSKNESLNTRYSLAFNLFPTGNIFAGDSSIVFEI